MDFYFKFYPAYIRILYACVLFYPVLTDMYLVPKNMSIRPL